MTYPARPLAERFWPKVDKSGECWMWTGGKSRYGHIGSGRDTGHRMLTAHRVSYELAFGPIPEGMCVLHRCDIPRCVNPDHLFLGTVADNNADRAAKGRSSHAPRSNQARGERVNTARLTAADVLQIRTRYAAGGIRQWELAYEFGVQEPAVYKIVHNRTWRHVHAA